MRETRHTGFCEQIKPGVARVVSAVDAQPHRRALVIGLKDAFPLLRIGRSNAFYQPGRVKEAQITLREFSEQFFLTALELTQYAVDQPFQLWTLNDDGAFNGFRQCGMRWNTGMQQLVEAHHDQVMDGALFARHRAFHQLLDHPLKLGKGAQHAEAQLLKQRFVFIGHFLLHGGQHIA